ncbi:hypothetical protein [uncultured Xanthomonas sp.]|uniref:hypothetical protein n=1 Tax=uncultured Xanthomonas sp. TaxID=152831 RepID=UPI0025F893D8|nr:hypothetical protein [uncultured Xanthomonas sp.]
MRKAPAEPARHLCVVGVADQRIQVLGTPSPQHDAVQMQLQIAPGGGSGGLGHRRLLRQRKRSIAAGRGLHGGAIVYG